MQRFHLISDFNIEMLGRYLTSVLGQKAAAFDVAPFGQVFQSLAEAGNSDEEHEAVVLWTRPEGIFDSYRKALYFQQVDHDAALEELDRYAEMVQRKARRSRYLFHPTWTLASGHRGYGMLDFAPGIGIAHLLARMNLRLAEQLGALSNCFLLDAERWLRQSGPRTSIPKMWFASKVPFKNVVFQDAAKDIAAALDGLCGKSRKLVVVDLDDTLWGGVVGETGWQGLRLGGHDHVGEAFVEFQRELKALTDRGVQLAIVSKNDEHVALDAIDHHPEMLLRRRDFAGWRINWSDKAANILELVGDLKLGIDSVVFIDDNPAERARVRESLGGRVLVPDWPQDPTEFSTALRELRCFDAPTISTEDRARAGMYAAERERRASSERVGSAQEWLATLQMVVRIEPLSPSNLPRAAQLLNKTNQLNLATRRLSEEELRVWAEAPNRRLWTFRVSDRFGDSGLTGIISVEVEGDTARIIDFLMSCRVMGRSVEEVMVHTAIEHVRADARVRRVVAEFLPTERNRPCLDFWQRSGFAEAEKNVFLWEPMRPYPSPGFLELVQGESGPTRSGAVVAPADR